MNRLHRIAFAITVFSLLATTSSTANLTTTNIVDLTELSISKVTGNRVLDGHDFTGLAREYNDTGTVIREEQFVSGRRHGYLKMWFGNEQPAFQGRYVNGRREGLTKSWWSNGRLRSRIEYVDDNPHGVALSWYISGERYQRFQYDHGVPIGLQQAWRKSGKLFSNFEYRDGRAFGLRNSNLCVELNDEQVVFN